MNRHANASAARALLARAFACISLCWAALTLAQESARQYDIDIGELPLAQALQTFSRQTDLQYGYLPTDEEEEQRLVGPIKGRFTASEVLAKLLPAGFTFEWINARTISIVSPPVNTPPGGVKEAVAGKDQQRSELTEDQRLSMENGGGKSGSARGPYAFDWRVTVERSRIADSIFNGLDLDISGTVFDREQIDASGASTVTDLFRYLTKQPNSMAESYLGDGTQFADLRGLGLDTTLVLINGRRVTATASALTANAFDLNSIPLGAVEGVEVLSDSTSAIHGTDAIGGVVNILLRDDVPEPRLDIDYGAAAGGAVERHVAFSASASGNRARGTIVLDYFDRSHLLGRERDFWNDQNFVRFGSIDWRLPASSPGNVRSFTSANLPGLHSSFAAIPAASGVLTPEDFLQTAGQRNLESLARYQSVLYKRTRKGVSAQGAYTLTPQASAYGEFLYVDRSNVAQFEPPAVMNARISAANPYNPFGVDVLVDALLTELGPRTFSRRGEMLRVVSGARGRAGQWDWEASLQKSQDDATTVRAKELDQMRLAAALAASDPRDALNLFGDSANSPESLNSLLAEPSQSRFRTELIQSVASIRGPWASLPTGPLRLTAGAEWREERARYDIAAPVDLAGSHKRTVASAFGELRVPLMASPAGLAATPWLSLVMSGRFDDYSDFGHTFNPEYALVWRPTSSLSLRASVAQAFRPPSLFELYVPFVDAQGPVVDPARNGELALPIWHAGGNPDLKPSSSDTLSVALQFEPNEPGTLRLGAAYWRIGVDETIGVPSAQRLVDAEDVFADRVVRGPPSAADAAAGVPGPVQFLDIRRLNYGTIRTSGVDVSASATIKTRMGRFEPSLTATWVHDFTTSNLIEGLDVNRVGVASLQGTIPRWRAAATISWNRRGFGLSTGMRYVPSYDDVNAFGRPNGREIGPQTTIDAQFSMDLEETFRKPSPWSGLEVRAGIVNLLDTAPPFAEVGLFSGYDPSQADLRQRFSYVKIAKKF